MVNRNSTSIKKQHLSHQNRSPVIVRLRPPKVIHVRPEEFMGLVQQVTGNPVSAAAAAAHSPNRHGSSMKATGLKMECQQTKVETFEKFTWTIENFSKLNSQKLYSETFVIGGYPWRILLFPNGKGVDCLSVYLGAMNTANFATGWGRDANFRFTLYNQVDSNMTITKETENQFNARENYCGFPSFIPLAEFRDPRKGFLVEDTCIIGAEVYVRKSEHENQAASITASLTSGGQAGHMEVEVPQPEDQGQDLKSLAPVSTQVCTEPIERTGKEMSASIGELMDFRGLGQTKNAFIPLLEEVCTQHPSLIECQQKRSSSFTGWAFTALGRVLHFLKTKKVKDMNDDACKGLQVFWDELKTFTFDLTWLEPHVQSAFGTKSYMEKATQVKKLKEDVVALELEMKRLKAKLAATEVDLEIASRNLSKAKEGFEERDLDAELGYGIPSHRPVFLLEDPPQVVM